jgi:hypothetical protein
MGGLEGRLQWRQHKLFKLCAKLLRLKKTTDYNMLQVWAAHALKRGTAPKICDSLIYCAPHKK